MTEIVGRLRAPSREVRDAWNRGPRTEDAFRSAFAGFPCLDQIERMPPPKPSARPRASARVAFWNAERLKYLEPSVELLRGVGADAILLCELDLGMARSENLHTTREIAAALCAGYVFAVEFVELDLGDARERRWHAGATNNAGLHGAGIVSGRPLDEPALVRLERTGRWFDGAFGERRVGGRIALMADFALAGSRVLLVSVHYESHSDPEDRLAQTRTLLDAIDRRRPGTPVLIGGYFNTSTFGLPEKDQAEVVAAALRSDPKRLALPIGYEPMFKELRGHGYEWEACNVIGAVTQRTRPDGTPPPPLGRIDWFFARGLDCSDPAVVPAVDRSGAAISDHELLAVTIRLPPMAARA